MAYQPPYGAGPGQNQFQGQFQPPVAQNPYQAGNAPPNPFGAPQPGMEPPQDAAGLTGQMADMSLGAGSVRGHKKKGRHAHHQINSSQSQGSQSLGAPPAFGAPPGVAQPPMTPTHWPGAAPQPGQPGMAPAPAPAPASAPLHGAPASSAQGRVDPEQIPSIPWSRDAPAQYYLEHVYPTMEQHNPPPSSVPFVAIDQGNATPKFARLTLNNIPSTSDALASTSIPLGLLFQPLAPQADGEYPVPVVDYGEIGPPRCRRCRTYVNPFMTFKSGGNRMVCNMCTFPNDVPPEYFAPTDPSGVRVDRLQRPELALGTVDFMAPKEYWTREPVPLRTLFLIDVSTESISKGFLKGICSGILHALYGDQTASDADNEGDTIKSNLVPGARIGIATFDREVQFYNLKPGLATAQMVVMPDIEDPFVPISEGLYVDPVESKELITSLLEKLPTMFSRVKYPDPVLLPALNAAMDSLAATGGKIVCAIASLPTTGPGKLFLRERQELRDTDAERKLFTTDHPDYMKTTTKMVENGIGVDFFMAAPQGGYLDVATIGFISEKSGGETYYYPNFSAPRDWLRIAKELKHVLTRETGFQALIKVRCSNGLQVAGYFGNFTQHVLQGDLELGTIDADKSFAVSFSYDGKLDAKLDAHFQVAVLYTTATGQRRIRSINVCGSVSDGAMESMKFVDQDAVVTHLAKQAVSKMPDRSLKDVRAQLTEKTIDILSAYRKNFSGSHPPGQLVLPEHLKEFAMFMLGLMKSRALKAGHEPTDRRSHDMRLIKSMGPMDLSHYLYPRVYSLHNLSEEDGFPNEKGHLRMPAAVRASYSRIEEGGAYIVDCGQIVLLWLHAQVSPNLLEDLFGPDATDLRSLDSNLSALPVLDTHLNAQVRNILQFLEDNRGSKALTLQLARQGIDGAEYEFARLLYEDRNNEAQSYVDWLISVHRNVQMELQGQRKRDDGEGGLTSLVSLRPSLW